MGRTFHQLTIKRGARVVASGDAAVNVDDPMDVEDAAKAIARARNEPDISGCKVQIHTTSGRWVKEVTLR